MKLAAKNGWRLGVLAVVVTAIALAVWLWHSISAIRAEIATPFVTDSAHWVGSAQCETCHEDRHASWYKTFHRTMTQDATPQAVVGKFDGQALTEWGGDVRPITRGGKYFFEYHDPTTGAIQNTVAVQRTVGSHRYQQYLTFDANSGTYYRLHYLWHIAEQRWVHMNAVFLGPDDKPFDEHIGPWNNNCIYCHNTGPEPNMKNYPELIARSRRGEAIDVNRDSTYDSRVAELGISCESCHGPGSAHVERNASMLRRWTLQLGGASDPSIVNPHGLSAERSTQVCGQCHGQRMPKDVGVMKNWISSGPPYRAGDDLNASVQPILKDTVPPGNAATLFSARFWNDGTPRLSAYEYQGLLQSPCYLQSKDLSCINCHSMHGGDSAGQITDKNRGNTPCLRCHDQLAKDVTAHTHHAATSPGSNCYNCHMPNAVYGVMTIHRSHRIAVPDPASDSSNARPDACTNCHADKSPQWAAQQIKTLWGRGDGTVATRADGVDTTLADLPATLLSGDPVQKAVAAYQMGTAVTGIDARQRMSLAPYLLTAMNDRYPEIRRFARNSLQALDEKLRAQQIDLGLQSGLQSFDFTAPETTRQQQLDVLWTAWRAADKKSLSSPAAATAISTKFEIDPALTQRLLDIGNHQEKQISIGE